MANELTINLSANLANGFLNETFNTSNLQVTQNALGSHNPVLIIGTSEENIGFGDIQVPGYAFFKNVDSDSAIRIGPASSGSLVDFILLNPGEAAMFRVDPNVTVIKAESAGYYPAKLQMLLMED